MPANVEQVKSSFGAVKCPNGDCGHILFEAGNRIRRKRPHKVLCRKCEEETIAVACLLNESDTGRLTVRLCCAQCGEDFDRRVPAIRKYCHGCKTYHLIYFLVFLGLPPV
ncbi:MAG: hypothetical protein COV74_00215 [Candidatus Omnitrophica bacterium CG11_big_fil_rev_8_21_14_0_20_45_26]|uniref:Uncharacterized protein n=1 Tax=Candidatus Abzuiibacterium crystallinum TaxID=1974748 RepID=A0A2H0LSX8_9BACT|nr:MAG: hypothetical protein COV74_00215 [Candidatus Omnitrophica bacterium CG11_big_fil_rev_8_21_14_0_20_45_26]PIW64637.1 MAG: hypothetical protein COW12_05560 [Candidatus Omnitrophica bacterium CG12_big_fil_rev_8_21_14_0_65_45_16]